MSGREYYLGIDIGSVSTGVVLLNEDFQVLHTSYDLHNGQMANCLRKSLRSLNLNQVKAVGYTSSAPSHFQTGQGH